MGSSTPKDGKTMASKATSKIVEAAIRERDKTVSKPGDKIHKKDDIVDDLVRMTAAGIGFVSEAVYARKEKKKQQAEKIQEVEETKQETAEQPSQFQQPSDAAPKELNEAIWDLDDAEREATAEETDSQPKKKEKDLAATFLSRHPSNPDTNPDTKLALPVLLPQRRPKTRARGFVRAYAPDLGPAGIDQDTFLDFIDSFNKALIPSPWLNAINLAGLVEYAFPDPLMILLGFGLEIATEAAMEVQSRFRTHKFLDRVNAEFFIPRGLICLVVTWKPDAAKGDELLTTVSFEGKAEKENNSETSLAQKMKNVASQKESGKEELQRVQQRMAKMMESSSGAIGWPDPAPLIFPSLDKVASTQEDGKKKNKFDRAEAWLDEYMDRRGQAKWIEKNPVVPMATALPKPEFRSRYADPNHPASSGDLVALVTGGRWQYGKSKPGPDKPDSDDEDDEKSEKRSKKEEKEEPKKESEELKEEPKPELKQESVGQSKVEPKDGPGAEATEAKGDAKDESEGSKEKSKEELKEESKKSKEARKKAEKEAEKQAKEAKEARKRAEKQVEKEAKEAKKKAEKEAEKAKKKAKEAKEEEKKSESSMPGLTSLLKQDVLYLLIMNLPAQLPTVQTASLDEAQRDRGPETV